MSRLILKKTKKFEKKYKINFILWYAMMFKLKPVARAQYLRINGHVAGSRFSIAHFLDRQYVHFSKQYAL